MFKPPNDNISHFFWRKLFCTTRSSHCATTFNILSVFFGDLSQVVLTTGSFQKESDSNFQQHFARLYNSTQKLLSWANNFAFLLFALVVFFWFSNHLPGRRMGFALIWLKTFYFVNDTFSNAKLIFEDHKSFPSGIDFIYEHG